MGRVGCERDLNFFFLTCSEVGGRWSDETASAGAVDALGGERQGERLWLVERLGCGG